MNKSAFLEGYEFVKKSDLDYVDYGAMAGVPLSGYIGSKSLGNIAGNAIADIKKGIDPLIREQYNVANKIKTSFGTGKLIDIIGPYKNLTAQQYFDKIEQELGEQGLARVKQDFAKLYNTWRPKMLEESKLIGKALGNIRKAKLKGGAIGLGSSILAYLGLKALTGSEDEMPQDTTVNTMQENIAPIINQSVDNQATSSLLDSLKQNWLPLTLGTLGTAGAGYGLYNWLSGDEEEKKKKDESI